MKPLTYVLILMVVQSASAQEHTKDTLDTVKKAMADKKAILLDVRERDEWNAGHVRDAVLIPLSALRKESVDPDSLKKLSREKVIYCHCAAGRRCLIATDILRKMGYDVRALKPGYKDLVEAGFPKAEK
jgi:phage shock protein E